MTENTAGNHQSPRVMPDRIAKELSVSAVIVTSNNAAVAAINAFFGCDVITSDEQPDCRDRVKQYNGCVFPPLTAVSERAGKRRYASEQYLNYSKNKHQNSEYHELILD